MLDNETLQAVGSVVGHVDVRLAAAMAFERVSTTCVVLGTVLAMIFCTATADKGKRGLEALLGAIGGFLLGGVVGLVLGFLAYWWVLVF